MDDAGLAYLRNINTKPGPGAGRSIDPSKPGPDDDFLGQMRATEFLAGQPHAEPIVWQFRTKTSGDGGSWTFWLGDGKPALDANFYELRPLYAKGEPALEVELAVERQRRQDAEAALNLWMRAEPKAEKATRSYFAFYDDDASNCPNTFTRTFLDEARLDERGNIVIDLRTDK